MSMELCTLMTVHLKTITTSSKTKSLFRNFIKMSMSTKKTKVCSIPINLYFGDRIIIYAMLLLQLYTAIYKMTNCNFHMDSNYLLIQRSYILMSQIIYATPLILTSQSQKEYFQIIFWLKLFHSLNKEMIKTFFIIRDLFTHQKSRMCDCHISFIIILLIMTELATSQVQKYFLTNNVYKRSRRYFDIVKLNQIEHRQQVERRMPKSTIETMQSRVGDSFICSQDMLNEKVHNDLDYFSKKIQSDEIDEIETNYTSKTKRANTIDMRKMLARSEQKTKIPYKNQEQFNNYSVSQHRARMSLDFDKFLGRNKNGTARNTRDPSLQSQFNPDKVGKSYQKMLFDQSTMRCFIDYNKNKKTVAKKENPQSPIYQPSKVQRGQYLTKKNVSPQLLQFYHGNGKQEPSQFDIKLLKENEYFWKSVREQRARLKDSLINKHKQDQQLKKIEQLLNRKKLPDQISEMCHQKYFKRNH